MTRYHDTLEVLKHFKNYLTGNLAVKALGFFTIPILTRLLTTDDYGTYQIFSSYVSLLMVVLTLNFHGSVARYYYEEPDDFREFVGTSLWGSLLLMFVPSLLILFFQARTSELLNIPQPLLVYLLVLLAVGVLYMVYNHICIATKESEQYAKLNVSRTYGGFVLGLLLLWLFPDSTYYALIWGRIGISIVVGFFVLRLMRKWLGWGVRRTHIRFIATYSVPLVPYTLSNVVLGQFDRVMIYSTIGASEAGLYSLAYNIGLIMSMITSSFQTALTPDWFRLMKEEKYLRIDALISRTFKLTLIAALSLVLFSQELLVILADTRYHTALPVIPIVVIGYIFDAMYKFYVRSIGYTNKTIYVTIVGVIGGAVNVLLNWMFISRYGYIAAAYTTVASFAIMFGLAWWVAAYHLRQRVTPLSVLWRPLAPFMLAIMLYYSVINFQLSFAQAVSLKAMILIAFCLWILASPLLARLERK